MMMYFRQPLLFVFSGPCFEMSHFATALRVSSSITTGHYVLNKDVDPKRLDSENNARRKHNNLERNDTAGGIVLQQHYLQ